MFHLRGLAGLATESTASVSSRYHLGVRGEREEIDVPP